MNRTVSETIQLAAKALVSGGVVCFPTETVYGIGCVYDDAEAYQRVVKVKERSPDKPLSMMFSDASCSIPFIQNDPKTIKMFDKFLPGEVTFLVRAVDGLPHQCDLGTGVIGVRVPDHPLALAILREVGKPCLVSSANKSGLPPCTKFSEVVVSLGGEVDFVAEGECTSNIPTTIVDLTNPAEIKLIREGSVPFSVIQDFWRSLS